MQQHSAAAVVAAVRDAAAAAAAADVKTELWPLFSADVLIIDILCYTCLWFFVMVAYLLLPVSHT